MKKDWFHFWLPICLGTLVVGAVLRSFNHDLGGYILGVVLGMVIVNLVRLVKE